MSSDEQKRKPPVAEDGEASLWTEPLNIKVNDNNNNELRFKIRRWTKLEKLMKAFFERNGKVPETVRFFYDGRRILASDTPDSCEMEDGDTIEVYYEQKGGSESCSGDPVSPSGADSQATHRTPWRRHY